MCNYKSSLLTHSQPGGDAKELYSVCGDGETTRIARLLPSPDEAEAPDKHQDARPIMATVKRGRYLVYLCILLIKVCI